MPTASSAATAVVQAGSGSVGAPPPAQALWRYVLADRDGNELADISTICSDKKVSRRLSRASGATGKVPANSALVNTLAGDGHPYLSVGRRTLRVYHRDSPGGAWGLYHNGIIWTLEDAGDENMAYTKFQSWDPLMWFRFRLCRDSTGNFSTPLWYGQGGSGSSKLAGGDFVRQLVRYSISNDGDPSKGYWDGEFGLDWQLGNFDMEVPPASDVLAWGLTNWPTTMADMLTLVTDTGAVDVTVTPYAGGRTLGILNAVNQAGNQSSIVHFDWGQGDYSIASIRRGYDLDTLTNKLYYYLGPKQSQNPMRFKGSITPTAANSPLKFPGSWPPNSAWPAEIDAAIAASRAAYEIAMDVRIYDDALDDQSTRPLWEKLWYTEALLRAEPRELLFITPVRNAPFDVNAMQLGDVITVNATAALRQGFSAQQRVYGFDVTIDDDATSQITDLLTSADG